MIFLTYAEIPTREICAETLTRSMSIGYIEDIIKRKNRNDSLAALCLLVETLKLAEIEPGEHIKISKNELGRPTIECDGVCDISLSHSGKYAACAVSTNGRVGVDIEKIPTSGEWTRIAKRFFTKDELAASESESGFAETWTRKEAYYKFLAEDIPLARVDSAKNEDVKCETFTIEDEYMLSVCAEADELLCKKPQKIEIDDIFLS